MLKKKVKYKNRTFFEYSDGYYRDGKTTLHKFKYESKYGAGVLPFFQLHHKDGDKSNNNINNFELLTPEQHAPIHKKMRRDRLFKDQLRFELM